MWYVNHVQLDWSARVAIGLISTRFRAHAIPAPFQGAYFAWKATAMGKNHINGKTFLEKRYVLFYFCYVYNTIFLFNYCRHDN